MYIFQRTVQVFCSTCGEPCADGDVYCSCGEPLSKKSICIHAWDLPRHVCVTGVSLTRNRLRIAHITAHVIDEDALQASRTKREDTATVSIYQKNQITHASRKMTMMRVNKRMRMRTRTSLLH